MKMFLIIFFLVLIVALIFLGRNQGNFNFLSILKGMAKAPISAWKFLEKYSTLRWVLILLIVGCGLWFWIKSDSEQLYAQATVRNGAVVVSFEIPDSAKHKRVVLEDDLTISDAKGNEGYVVFTLSSGSMHEYFSNPWGKSMKRWFNKGFVPGENIVGTNHGSQKGGRHACFLQSGAELHWKAPPYRLVIQTSGPAGLLEIQQIPYRVVKQQTQ